MDDRGKHLVVGLVADLEDGTTIADREAIADLNIAHQECVIDFDYRTIRLGIADSKLDGRAGGYLNTGLTKGPRSHLGPREINQYSNTPALFSSDSTNAVQPLECFFDRAVRQTKASDIHARPNQGPQGLFVFGGRPDGGDNFGAAMHTRERYRSPSHWPPEGMNSRLIQARSKPVGMRSGGLGACGLGEAVEKPSSIVKAASSLA